MAYRQKLVLEPAATGASAVQNQYPPVAHRFRRPRCTVKPMRALKGGDEPHSRRRLMHAPISAQVAFCFLVVFVASFDRLSTQSAAASRF
jgi:hypothetical protein